VPITPRYIHDFNLDNAVAVGPSRLAILAALGYAFLIFVSTGCHAKSELQLFEASLPSPARGVFAGFNSCAVITTIDQANARAPFEKVESKIAEACEKQIKEAAIRMNISGMPAAEIDQIIGRFRKLAFAERKLRFEGKEPPGFERNPSTSAMIECLNTRALENGACRLFRRKRPSAGGIKQ